MDSQEVAKTTPKGLGGSLSAPIWPKVVEPPNGLMGVTETTSKTYEGGSASPLLASYGSMLNILLNSIWII